MNAHGIRQATHAGRRVYGTMVVSTSPHWPPQLATCGVDFVFLDTEHIASDWNTVSWLCCAYSGVGLAPIVRIPQPDPIAASQALDAGAAGVVAPYVETVEQVRHLRGAVRCKPLKGDKLARILEGRDAEPQGELGEYLEKRNQTPLLLVNIESVPAIENLDAILETPGLDGILVGPHDLSCSLEIPKQYQDPRFTRVLRDIFEKTRARSLIAGVHFMACGPLALAREWMSIGVNLHIQHADMFYAVRGIAQEIEYLRSEATAPDLPGSEKEDTAEAMRGL